MCFPVPFFQVLCFGWAGEAQRAGQGGHGTYAVYRLSEIGSLLLLLREKLWTVRKAGNTDWGSTHKEPLRDTIERWKSLLCRPWTADPLWRRTDGIFYHQSLYPLRGQRTREAKDRLEVSKFTEDYIEVEKDSKFFLESIEDREERLKRREERKALREEKEDKEEKEEKKKHLFGKKDKKDKKDKKNKDDESLVNGEVSLENEFEYEEAEAETSEIIDDVKEEINEDTKLSEDIFDEKDNDTIVNDIENEESYEVRERDTKYDTKAFWDEADDMLKKNFLSD